MQRKQEKGKQKLQKKKQTRHYYDTTPTNISKLLYPISSSKKNINNKETYGMEERDKVYVAQSDEVNLQYFPQYE